MHIIPASGRNRQAEIQRLNAAMPYFKTNAPEVMITEIIKSSDPCYRSQEATAPSAKERAGLIERGTFRMSIKEDLPDDANVLGSRYFLCIKDFNTE